ncbi:MAG: hypothetical protein LBG89_02180 [Rickettsiales bacterium]|nr:hypothetical protein [Rickettsiales bacterium]
MMKKILMFSVFVCSVSGGAYAWQLETQRTLGSGEGKNQNVLVKCTTASGQVSSQTCSVRRYAKCQKTSGGGKNCNGWQPWSDVRNPGRGFTTWQDAAKTCCAAKGLK